MEHIKSVVCGIVGVLGGSIASLFGGWDTSLKTLIIFMIVDYITGFIVAAVFKRSSKTDTGGLESYTGWKGICRKGVTLLIVLVAYQLDLVVGVNWIRDTVVIAFILNEVISITENAGLMGIKLPAPIINAIDILRKKVDEETQEHTPEN